MPKQDRCPGNAEQEHIACIASIHPPARGPSAKQAPFPPPRPPRRSPPGQPGKQASLKCPKVETGPPGEQKTGPRRAETKRRARTTKHAPSALTPMPAESSAGAQTLVVAPLRAAGNQPHGNPSYHPSCNRQPDARYALHNSIDNHHPALLSTIDTGAKLIPAWPVESPHIARAREAIRTTRYKLCRALIASLTMPLLMR